MRRFQAGPLAVVVALAAIAPGAALEAMPIGRLAGVGDSLTDEYFEGISAFSRAWTELLVEERAIDMGPLADTDWLEPRRTGYEDNWARAGATIEDAIVDGQHTGAAAGVAGRGVTHVVVFIGTNDFSPLTGNAFWNPVYAGAWNQGQIDAYVGGRVANLEAILDVLEPTGARIVLVAVPDTTAAPLVEGFFGDDAGRERAAQAVALYSDALHAIADERDLVFADGWALTRLLFGSPLAERATIDVGNVAIDLDMGDPDGTHPDRAWVADNSHPGTVIQGISANLIVHSLNRSGAGIQPFSEEEIVTQAGLVYGGSDTLEDELGMAIADFVFDYATIFSDGFQSADTSAWSVTVP